MTTFSIPTSSAQVKASALGTRPFRVPSLAVIGCGAIAESFHLPALAEYRDVVKHTILVDTDVGRATRLAERFGVGRIAQDYRAVLPDVDGVIVTTPHHLHYPIALESIRNGRHVLCEKPVAESVEQVHHLVTEAAVHGVHLAINNNRRLYPSYKKIHQLLREGVVGSPHYVEFFEGEKFDWPAATGFYVGSGGPARGVLLDKGAHVLDLICWWLGGKPEVTLCQDDSFGGIEAVCRVYFAYKSCEGVIHLSWLSRYPNTFRIEGDRGAIEGAVFDWRSFTLINTAGQCKRLRVPSETKNVEGFGHLLVGNFLDVVSGTATPLVPAADVIPSIAMIEECYQRRQRFPMRWQAPCPEHPHG